MVTDDQRSVFGPVVVVRPHEVRSKDRKLPRRRESRRVSRCLLVLILVTGCYAPSPPNGALRCSSDGQCPEGYYCAEDEACWREGDRPDPLSQPPVLISPRNGASTGTVHAAQSRRPLLRWRTIFGATSYEVQVDDSCDPASFRSCELPSPEASETVSESTLRLASELAVSTTAPVGRRYFWRVRGCSGARCTPWSEVRYVDVGRLATDFTGNGDTDLVIGNGNASVNGVAFVGEAYVAPGTRAGAPNLVTLTAPDGASRDHYGTAATSAGDVDGDGFADLAVGAFLSDNAGRVYLYRGGTSWPASAPSQILRNPEGQTAAYFGRAMASGDLDGDGHSDLVVGAELQQVGGSSKGKVFIYHGQASSAGLLDLPSTFLPNPGNAFSTGFGSALAIGDFDGDGYADLAATAREMDRRGVVHIFPGKPGAVLVRAATLALSVDTTSSEIGLALAAGDFNGDGYADLAVGAPLEPRGGMMEVGHVHVFSGGPDGIADGAMPELTLDNPGIQPGSRFGWALAAAPFEADDSDELAVSAAFHDSSAGRVYVYASAERAGLFSLPTTTLVDPAPMNNGVFGLILAVGDRAPADGFFDLFISARRDSGIVYLLDGTASGPAMVSGDRITGAMVPGGILWGSSLSSASP
jgi:hypothetical protein